MGQKYAGLWSLIFILGSSLNGRWGCRRGSLVQNQAAGGQEERQKGALATETLKQRLILCSRAARPLNLCRF